MVTKYDETQAAPTGFRQRWIRFDGSVLNGFDDDPWDCGCNSTAHQATARTAVIWATTRCGSDALQEWIIQFERHRRWGKLACRFLVGFQCEAIRCLGTEKLAFC